MDASNKSERAKRLSQAYNYLVMNQLIRNQRELAAKMKTPPSNLSTALTHSATKSYARRFCIATGHIFNLEWILDGTGNMLPATQGANNSGIIVDRNNGNINQYNNTPTHSNPSEDCAFTMVPLVPAKVSQQPNLDVWDYMQGNITPEEPLVKQFSNYHLYHHMLTDAMSPRLKAGDTIALRRIETNSIIVNGDVYCVDIKGAGFSVREVTKTERGYLLHAVNERYKDFIIQNEDIMGLYKVIGAIITHI